MNRYPVWKYAIILVALVVGVLYTLPNFFGEVPAVQVSSGKSTVKVDRGTRQKVDQALAQAQVEGVVSQDETSIRIQVQSPEEQLKAKEALNAALNAGDPQDPDYVVALNLVPRTPAPLAAIGAKPMALGLDLRGGVHLMLQVDMDAAIVKRADSLAADVRTTLRDKNVRHGGVSRNGRSVEVRLRDAQTATAARAAIADQFPELDVTQVADGQDFKIVGAFKPQALREVQDRALKQNITTLHNRVNQLGVSEPVIQQQGIDRIVVQLPGLQDAARAKDILGRTAVLEVRAVNMSAAAASGEVPFGSERFFERRRDGTMAPVVVQRQVILTGDRIVDASSTFDDKQRPAVSVRLDQVGGRIMRDFTRDNVGKLMAMVLFEKKKGEAISVATIQSEFGSSFQITGAFSVEETNNLALLLRAGALAAPMEIVEEMTIGPTLGAENIAKGFHSVAWGFAAICAFMVVYYMLFGLFSGLALAVNLLLLVAILSMLQATLTLPGMAAMALALGMAIDSNVLINERVREELRNGASPQAAIHAGYDRAWATILDSNVTTLIAGLALLAFGSGPVRGFAVVHCIGILTSMFSAVFFSRGLVNFWYGRKKKLKSVSIGTVWRPAPGDAITKPE
ncbi:protein translocase subunit SecD [Ramlibacter algicola]|uniref:Protein translocase subunit SecD n=1 Tax=Ramlibacter algicola TaxID=2795217 RepID=A0A934PYX3_9BURK|nr:protein translocase subunit SecD [Ramlibacter algicola]MBK0391242.1 protein translocase subunit SecD [Ramlibacter algicola]